MSRSTQSRGDVEQAGNQGKEQSRRFTPPSPLDMVSPPHLWRRRGSASDGARCYGEKEGRRMGEEAGSTRGQNSGSFELREGGGDRREAARSVGGGGGIQVGKSR